MKAQTIFRIVKNNRFVSIDKAFVNDPALSLSAKGLLLYCLSKPNNWSHNESDISHHCTNGRDSIRSATLELIAAGYIRKLQPKAINGQFQTSLWLIYENKELSKDQLDFTENPDQYPFTGNPSTDNPSTDIPLPDIPSLESPCLSKIDSNIDISKIKEHQIQSIKPWTIDKVTLLFTNHQVEIPIDFDLIDGEILKTSLDAYVSRKETIKNHRAYLSKLLNQSPRLTNDQISQIEKAWQIAQESKAIQKSIDEITFRDDDEIRDWINKLPSRSGQFNLYYDKPKLLSEHSILILKRLKYKATVNQTSAG